MHAAVRIAGDNNVTRGRGDAGVADEREVFRIFASDHAAMLAGDFLGVVGAAVEHHDDLDTYIDALRGPLRGFQAGR